MPRACRSADPRAPTALRALLERDPAARREVEYRMMKQVAFELYARHGDAAVQAFLDRADAAGGGEDAAHAAGGGGCY